MFRVRVSGCQGCQVVMRRRDPFGYQLYISRIKDYVAQTMVVNIYIFYSKLGFQKSDKERRKTRGRELEREREGRWRGVTI